jgi:hypothetical protein
MLIWPVHAKKYPTISGGYAGHFSAQTVSNKIAVDK